MIVFQAFGSGSQHTEPAGYGLAFFLVVLFSFTSLLFFIPSFILFVLAEYWLSQMSIRRVWKLFILWLVALVPNLVYSFTVGNGKHYTSDNFWGIPFGILQMAAFTIMMILLQLPAVRRWLGITKSQKMKNIEDKTLHEI